MSDEPQQTYSAREIVLEFFPATNKRLVPSPHAYKLIPNPEGEGLVICEQKAGVLLRLIPIAAAGNINTQLSCDFCQHNAPRKFFQLFRVEIPASGGRRFCYVSLCSDYQACELRRLDDTAIEALLNRSAN